MSEFRHYATHDEALDILRDVVKTHGLRLVPLEPTLVEPKIATYSDVTDEVVEKLARFAVVELEGAFTQFPIAFGRRDSGSAAGTYYVENDVGPRLEYLVPRLNPSPRPTLTPGSISYRKHFKNPTTKEIEQPSAELKAAYKAVVGTMKKRMVTVKTRGETVWVGRHTKQLLDEGKAFID